MTFDPKTLVDEAEEAPRASGYEFTDEEKAVILEADARRRAGKAVKLIVVARLMREHLRTPLSEHQIAVRARKLVGRSRW